MPSRAGARNPFTNHRHQSSVTRFHDNNSHLLSSLNKLLEVFVEKTWLNAVIVLVFTASIFFVITFERVVINLTDLNTRINADRLYTEDLESPESDKTSQEIVCPVKSSL